MANHNDFDDLVQRARQANEDYAREQAQTDQRLLEEQRARQEERRAVYEARQRVLEAAKIAASRFAHAGQTPDTQLIKRPHTFSQRIFVGDVVIAEGWKIITNVQPTYYSGVNDMGPAPVDMNGPLQYSGLLLTRHGDLLVYQSALRDRSKVDESKLDASENNIKRTLSSDPYSSPLLVQSTDSHIRADPRHNHTDLFVSSDVPDWKPASQRLESEQAVEYAIAAAVADILPA